MDKDAFLGWAVDLGFLWMPPISCACAWWQSLRDSPNIGVSCWRRTTTWAGLVLATPTIAFGAFMESCGIGSQFHWLARLLLLDVPLTLIAVSGR